jgi:hypothetical protein
MERWARVRSEQLPAAPENTRCESTGEGSCCPANDGALRLFSIQTGGSIVFPALKLGRCLTWKQPLPLLPFWFLPRVVPAFWRRKHEGFQAHRICTDLEVFEQRGCLQPLVDRK